jgi:hypothetical protein
LRRTREYLGTEGVNAAPGTEGVNAAFQEGWTGISC